MLLIAKKMNKYENLFLRAANNRLSTVAMDVEEKSGEEVGINRENSLRSNFQGSKKKKGELRAHLPQGSLR